MGPKRQHSDGAPAGEPPTKRLSSSTTSKPIKVIVGTEDKLVIFYIHKDVLTRHSDFFRAALLNDWREAGEGEVRLPEHDPDVFEMFADFVYSGKLMLPEKVHSELDTAMKDTLVFNELYGCWELAEMLLSSTFGDAASDSLATWAASSGTSPKAMHKFVYQSSSFASGMKRLLVDFAVFGWPNQHFDSRRDADDSAAFFIDTTVRALSITPQQRDAKFPWIDAGCEYHDHGDEKPCYKTMF